MLRVVVPPDSLAELVCGRRDEFPVSLLQEQGRLHQGIQDGERSPGLHGNGEFPLSIFSLGMVNLSSHAGSAGGCCGVIAASCAAAAAASCRCCLLPLVVILNVYVVVAGGHPVGMLMVVTALILRVSFGTFLVMKMTTPGFPHADLLLYLAPFFLSLVQYIQTSIGKASNYLQKNPWTRGGQSLTFHSMVTGVNCCVG